MFKDEGQGIAPAAENLPQDEEQFEFPDINFDIDIVPDFEFVAEFEPLREMEKNIAGLNLDI